MASRRKKHGYMRNQHQENKEPKANPTNMLIKVSSNHHVRPIKRSFKILHMETFASRPEKASVLPGPLPQFLELGTGPS